jgi:DnaK suppressor protein
MQTIESRLRTRRSEILSDIRNRLHTSGDPGKLALLNHLEEGSDWVAADLLNDTDILLLSHEVAMLAEIDAALARIKDGSYGTCMRCGDPIPPARLDAQPTARFCLACQERFEKSQGEHSAAI